MNFSYGKGNKVYGKDVEEARYNALLETYYNHNSETQNKIKSGKNYFLEDTNTGKLLERRLVSGDVYIPDEDEILLKSLSDAYNTTKYNLGKSCSNQKDEYSCKSLKFRGKDRCDYEKKWLSFFRGGTCIIDENIVEHLVNNLKPLIKIKWESLKVIPLKNSLSGLPNPDNLSKEDVIDLLHDLGYHMKSYFENDLISAVEKATGKNIIDLDIQELLYYLYLFSYIIYASWYLDKNDFKRIFTQNLFEKLNKSISKYGTGKNTLINFIVEFNSNIPQRKNRTKVYGWEYPSLIGPVMILLLFSFIPTTEAARPPTWWNQAFFRSPKLEGPPALYQQAVVVLYPFFMYLIYKLEKYLDRDRTDL